MSAAFNFLGFLIWFFTCCVAFALGYVACALFGPAGAEPELDRAPPRFDFEDTLRTEDPPPLLPGYPDIRRANVSQPFKEL